MCKDERRRAACRLWTDAAKLNGAWHALEELRQKKGVLPDDILLEKIQDIIMSVEEDITEVGETIYPEVKKKE